MGTRQLRLSDPALVKSKIPGFVGKEITVILSDNTSIFGTLGAVEQDEILLMNMRLKKVRCSFADIAEVYMDTKA